MENYESIKLKRPPIQEALIDIQFEFLEQGKCDIKLLESFVERVKKPKSKVSPKIRYNIGFNFTENENTTPKREALQEGFVITNEDKIEIVQITLNNFTFNRLKPYSSWDEIKNQAKYYWTNLISEFGNVRIKRIALRYINNIEIPVTQINELGLNGFFTMLPTIPSSIANPIEHFTLQIVMPNNNLKGIVNQTFEVKGDKIEYILDIDTFLLENSENLDKIWDEFEDLRKYKNQLFFGATTERLRSLYN